LGLVAQNIGAVGCTIVGIIVGLYEDHEIMKFTETMNFGICREF